MGGALPAVRVGGGCQWWLCHRVEAGGIVAWLCHTQWAAGLVAGVKNWAAANVAGLVLLLAMAVMALADASCLPVVEAKWVNGPQRQAKLMLGGWNGVERVRNCTVGAGPMYSRCCGATFQQKPLWFCFLRWHCEVDHT